MALGTSSLFTDWLIVNPDLIDRLADPSRLRTLARDALIESSGQALAWRRETAERQRALHRWRDRHLLGVAARDVFGVADVDGVGADLTVLAEAVLERTVLELAPEVPFAVVALGRFAGGELAYASDVDLVFVHEAAAAPERAEAMRLAVGVLRFVGGSTGAQRIYRVDTNLRPEGRDGPLTRSLDGYSAYFARWADVWERQAMARARPVAGDPDLGRRFAEVVGEAVWGRPFTDDHAREVRRLKARIERERIPAGEDPEFHLKLGKGAMADVEWTAQLIQLRTGVRAPGTIAALAALEAEGALSAGDAEVLAAAYRFCELARNRWYLVGARPGGGRRAAGPAGAARPPGPVDGHDAGRPAGRLPPGDPPRPSRGRAAVLRGDLTRRLRRRRGGIRCQSRPRSSRCST